jgi:hypothetical protein
MKIILSYCILIICSFGELAYAQIKIGQNCNVGIKDVEDASISARITRSFNTTTLYCLSDIDTNASITNLWLNTLMRNSGSNTIWGQYNGFRSDSGTGEKIGLQSYMTGTCNGIRKSLVLNNYGSGNGAMTGAYVDVNTSGSGSKTGIGLRVIGNGNGYRTGIAMALSSSDSASTSGVVVGIDHYSPIGAYGSVGAITMYSGSGGTITGNKFSIYRNTGSNGYVTGNHIEIFPASSTTGSIFGQWININGNGNGDRYGAYYILGGTGSTGQKITLNTINNMDSDNGQRVGIANAVYGGGTAQKWGISNHVQGSGSGIWTGIQNNVLGTGTGNRYGIVTLMYDTNSVWKRGMEVQVYSTDTNSIAFYASNTTGNGQYTGKAGYFNGNVHVTGTLTQGGSDANIKKQVKNISSIRNRIMQLRPVEFEYKNDLGIEFPKGKRFGLIAQEVEALFPELVYNINPPSDYNYDDPKKPIKKAKIDQYKGVEYDELIPLLLKVIQEQEVKLLNWKKELKNLNK